MTNVETHDLLPVHSRVSWGAIFAGAATALTTYLILTMLGMALGLTISPRVADQQLGIGALVWAAVTLILCLFLGGWVSSQLTVGENRTEAAFYGLLVWGTVFLFMLGMMATGVHMGFNAIMSVASGPLAERAVNLNESDLRAAGFTDEQINSSRAQFDRLRNSPERLSQEMRSAAQDPRAVQAAWWTFGGMLLSLFASIAGALVGSGPQITLTALGFRSIMMREEAPVRQTVNR